MEFRNVFKFVILFMNVWSLKVRVIIKVVFFECLSEYYVIFLVVNFVLILIRNVVEIFKEEKNSIE